jgi:hypothetical protein
VGPFMLGEFAVGVGDVEKEGARGEVNGIHRRGGITRRSEFTRRGGRVRRLAGTDQGADRIEERQGRNTGRMGDP